MNSLINNKELETLYQNHKLIDEGHDPYELKTQVMISAVGLDFHWYIIAARDTDKGLELYAIKEDDEFNPGFIDDEWVMMDDLFVQEGKDMEYVRVEDYRPKLVFQELYKDVDHWGEKELHDKYAHRMDEVV